MNILNKVITVITITALASNITLENPVTLEELIDRTTVLGDLRQDEVESLMTQFISAVFTAESTEEAKRSVEILSEYITENEKELLKSNVGYSGNNYKILETNINYVSGENSWDGAAREFVEVKFGNNDKNMIYLLEFGMNDTQIFKHNIWRY